MLLHLAVLFFAFPPALGSNQNPKLYVQTQLMEHVESLRTGFLVRMPETLFREQLHDKLMPTVYYAAIALHSEKQSFRSMEVDTAKMKNGLQMADLEFDSWYYVCTEFENQDRLLRAGNVSTSCVLRRTLDKYGQSRDTTVVDAKVADRIDTQLIFDLDVDVNFPMQYDIYLENAPRVQSYILSRPMNLRVVFSDLVPDFAYGRFCVAERPLVHSYTCMGRSVEASLKKCWFSNLQTMRKIDKLPLSEARQMRSADVHVPVGGISQSNSAESMTVSVLIALALGLVTLFL